MRLILACAALAAVAAPAAANPYEAFIDVETEEDLYDLLASQQITEDTFDVLLDLFHRGVDLNTAGRAELYSLPNLTYEQVDAILAYRAEQGFIRDPAELVAARVLTEDELLSIAAFLLVRDPTASPSTVHGFVQTQAQYTVGDPELPAVGARARVLVGRDLTAGVAAVMTRLRPGEVVYDPNRDALLVDEPGLGVHVPKAYVHWNTDDAEAIAGTYRIGFGQRLTFDASSDYTPNGIYRDDQLHRDPDLARRCRQSTGELAESPCADDHRYVTSDLRWREALLGVAAGVRRLPVGDGWVQLYAWGSYQPRSIYQYELYDRTACDDPANDDDPRCAAPDVFIRPDGDRLQPAPELAYSTLPDMFAEALAGANATYFLSRRNYLGVTAYAARDVWLVDDGVDGDGDRLALDFQEWSARPPGGEFGAIGLATSIGAGPFDLGGELAHSFDAAPGGGGGPGAILRATYTEPRKHELELAARYYHPDFANPYARPIAAADEYDGQRARDEAGVRLRYAGRVGRVRLRAGVDGWTNPTTELFKSEGYLRADVEASRSLRYGAWVDVREADRGGPCAADAGTIDTTASDYECKPRRASGSGRVSWKIDREVTVASQLQYEVLEGDRQDLSAWLIATYRPTPDLRLRGRIRYLSEGIGDTTTLEDSLWTYLEGWVRLRTKDRLRVRLDVFVWLDDRESTAEREPSPELRLWAMYDARF